MPRNIFKDWVSGSAATFAGLILVAVTSLILLQFGYVQWQRSYLAFIPALDNLRNARNDLTKAYLFAEKASGGDETVTPQDALALIDHAALILKDSQQGASNLAGITAEALQDEALQASLESYHLKIERFRQATTRRLQQPNEPESMIDQRQAFYELEQQADQIDRDLYRILDQIAADHRSLYRYTQLSWIAFLLLVGIVLAVTESKRLKAFRDLESSQRATELERNKLRTILQAMNKGVYITDADYNILYINPALEREFGPYTGQKCYQYLHGLEEPCAWCKNEQVFAGESVVWEWHSSLNNRDYELFDTPVYNEDGSVHKLEIFHDITAHKQNEEKLRELAGSLEAIIQTSPLAIYVIDPSGKVTLWNPACEKMFGWKAKEALSQPLPIIPPGSQEEFHRLRQIVLDGQPFADQEILRQRKNGEPIYLSLSTAPLYDPGGNVNSVLAIAADVTHRKEYEEELKSLNRTLRTISECNMILVRSRDRQTLLDDICRLIVEVGGYAMAWIGLVDEGNPETMRAASHYGLNGGCTANIQRHWLGHPGEGSPLRRAVQSGQVVILEEEQIREQAAFFHAGPEPCRFNTLIAFPLNAGQKTIGVLAIFSARPEPFNPPEIELLQELADDLAYGVNALSAELARHQAEEQLKLANQELMEAYDATLLGWANALELRERETAGHSRRVVKLTLEMARRMGMQEDEILHVYRGALLHDIGKLGIPDNILLKPATLTDEEWVIMKQHPTFAYDLLSPIPYLRPALDIPYCHHERWDGGGYPRGLSGEDIPLPARIFAVVDVWDALASHRPYRPAWPEKAILDYLAEQAGKAFDPRVVKAFFDAIAKKDAAVNR